MSASQSPRICIFLESYYPVVGGMESQAYNLAETLARLGVSQLVVTRRTDPGLAAQEMVNGLLVHRVPPTGRSSRNRWALLVTAPPALARLRDEYDVIFVPGFRGLGLAAVRAARGLGKRCVLKAESCGEMSGAFFAGGLRRIGLRPDAGLPGQFLRWRNRQLARADAFVSMSSELTEEFVQGGVPRERITLIPQTVEVARFCPVSGEQKKALRARLGLPADELLVIFTGRLVSYKGLPVLADVWRDLCREFPVARLVLVGAGGVDQFNCEEQLRNFVRSEGLQERVIFTGARANVHEYLQASDIFAFPTENEAFGISLIEAMACGLPVVSTAIGGIKDIIQPDANGLMIAPGDRSALRAALRQLLADAGLRDRLGEAAAASVRQHYTREIVGAQYLKLFTALMPNA